MTAKTRKVDLEELLEAALRRRGMLLPLTGADLAEPKPETQTEGKLPPRLAVTPDFGSKAQRFRLTPDRVDQSEAHEEMARAARGGGRIDAEVEAQMALDRKAAAGRSK